MRERSARPTPASIRGAVLLETALVLPVVLLFILFFIWFAVMLNTRASLMSAVENGMRAAITRARIDLVGSDLLPDLSAWRDYNSRSAAIDAILVSPDLQAGSPMATYNDWNAHLFSELRDAPLTYLYALAYVTESMRGALGNSVRYPCDPRDPDGAGCLKCVFLNPCTFNTANAAEQRCIDLTMYRIIMRCEYRPEGALTGTINGLLRLLTGSSRLDLLSYTAFLDIPQDTSNWYKAGI